MVKKRCLCLIMLVLSCTVSSVWCAASSGSDDDDDDSYPVGDLPVVTQHPDGRITSVLVDVELNNLGDITAAQILPLLPRNRYISERQRLANVNAVLAVLREREPVRLDRVRGALTERNRRNEAIRRGLDIAVDAAHVEPFIEWIVKEVVTEDSEFLGHELDKETKIKWISTGVSFVTATGLTALIAYIGSLWA